MAIGDWTSSIRCIESSNIGIVLDSFAENGYGFKRFYNVTMDHDEEIVDGVDIEAETDIFSLFAVFQTPGDFYVKGKLGYLYSRAHNFGHRY